MPQNGKDKVFPKRPLHVAMIGTRGVPARYGGFETCVEEVGRRLADRGHRITVYCRRGYYHTRTRQYQGMELVHLPHFSLRQMETLTHTYLSVLHALRGDFDVYMVFNAANTIAVLPLRLFGKKIIINPDGLEWRRAKWGWAGRTFYRLSERLAGTIANRLVSDSLGIQEHHRRAYGRDSTFIAYGADPPVKRPPRHLQDLGLEPQEYYLQITRFEPENNPLLTLKAFRRLNTTKKIVLVGGNRHNTSYVKALQREVGPGVVLPGFIYEPETLAELWANCHAYIHGNEVGGTNPALLQAMAAGCCVLSIDVSFNREVLADAGRYFDQDVDSLARAMAWTEEHQRDLDAFRDSALKRIKQHYTWGKVADAYEKLFLRVRQGAYPWRPWAPGRNE